MEGDWDYLLILDACRFDFFKEQYGKYLEGELTKVRSRGSDTGEWLYKTFPKYYPDITYFSANGHINSLGLSIGDTHNAWNYEWRATEHFSKVIDVWDFGWVEKLGTVPLRAMSEALIQSKGESKKVAHYIQPHPPFIDLEADGWNFHPTEGKTGTDGQKSLKIPFKGQIGPILRNIIGQERIWALKHKMGMPPSGSFELGLERGRSEKSLRK